ncbi:MAG: tRNA (uridine(34)/cytosine(34)/5-carboxymethylaminomethyluridine(34)-2'-O)-methyltransferase TrmL [Deltaproteobacteria bacterium RIFCSPLOWO2_02_FULL_44_10]|nr:MAG: tRNA (uridine(34)/cytosine(34)/5-carboxymethylaminomethyluridine(34)-2'-O)-methyltransferase TrmL [Deltaproteobacteria bacterium RIFCSPLOWO2_02_FULL_44_10]
MKVVLYQPEIPQNTGNIGRLCVATQTPLYLVKPLGFAIDDKEVKRAGLDYWQYLDLTVIDDLGALQKREPNSRVWYLTTKTKRIYSDMLFQQSDIFVFGPETTGLPQNLLHTNEEALLTLPMWGKTRSLNLSTAVGIVVYEAYRQLGFRKTA